MARLTICPDRCTGCGACASACPFSALQVREGLACADENCQLCGACVEVCPFSAIALQEDVKTFTGREDWQGILVFLQVQDGAIHPVGFEMIAKAKELAEQCDQSVYAVIAGGNITGLLDGLRGLGVDTVYVYEDPRLEIFRPDVYANVLADCIGEARPSSVLFGATLEARVLAPHVAVRFHTGLTADCTALEMESGRLVQIRPAFGGNIMAKIVTENARPQMATVRYKVMAPARAEGNAMPKIAPRTLPEEALESPIEQLESQCIRSKDLALADVIVAIGNGLRKRGDIPLFQAFADKIAAQLACSRSLVEKGFMPIGRQIGLSGKSVRPRLIITLGVAGSIQFMAGMSGASHICAVNTDADAPIFSIAHTPMVGDMYDVVEALMGRL
ncbi:MAG: electron transfer flavoprotein subunit alpha [Christensenellales bacterium]|jgi:electron transfer flavoprotein alpha subunit